jgi:hypothetical protein
MKGLKTERKSGIGGNRRNKINELKHFFSEIQ